MKLSLQLAKNRFSVYYATGVAGMNYITKKNDEDNILVLCSPHEDVLVSHLQDSLLQDKKTTTHWSEFFSIKKGYLAELIEKSKAQGYSMVLADGKVKEELLVG